MHTNLLSHKLSVEFPELADTIASLKENNAHFVKLLDEHTDLDKQITKDEEGLKAISDDALHTLKQQRAKLKDVLYQMAIEAK